MPFIFENLTNLPIQITICPDVRSGKPNAVVVVFSDHRINGPRIKEIRLTKRQVWTVPEMDYGQPIRFVDKLALRKRLLKRPDGIHLYVEGLMN